jgi:hypothetical protein
MPEIRPNASSVLGGTLATNVAEQQICPIRVVDRFIIVVDSVTQFFILQSFSSLDGRVDPELVTPSERLLLCGNILPRFKSVDAVVSFTIEALEATLRTGVTGSPGSMVSAEPALMPYAQ